MIFLVCDPLTACIPGRPALRPMLLAGTRGVSRPSSCCSLVAGSRHSRPVAQLLSSLHQQQVGMSSQSTPLAAAGSRSGGQPDEAGATATPPASDPIVQWVVLRRDLWTELGWPLGPVIAQACHASSAAMFTHLSDPLTQAYIAESNIDHMHKVVLEVKTQQQLENLSSKLQQEGILHKLWVEQPENYPTCLATKPYRRSQVAGLFKKYQLCKAALGPAAGK